MIKREKLVEVLARDFLFPWVHSTGANWNKMTGTVRMGYRKRAECLLLYLESERVVNLSKEQGE